VTNPEKVNEFNFDCFFNSETLVNNKAEKLDDFMKSLKTSENIAERRYRAFEFVEKGMADPYPECEKFPSNYYEDGIASLKTTFKICQQVAIERLSGNEQVTFADIMKKMNL
jgi:hypothetical protein